MIDNVIRGRVLLLSALLSLGCGNASAQNHTEFQGVVELDERTLGFELGGRLANISVAEGDLVSAGDELAELDDALASLSVAAHEAELEARRAQLSLLEAGPRRTEVRAAQAQWRAARAAEAQLERERDRQLALERRGVAPAVLGERLTSRHASAQAQSSALAQRARALRDGARPEERQAAAAAAAAAEHGLRAAQERRSRHGLRAPSPGTVLDVHVEPGEVVAPGTPVVTVADLRRPYVDVFVPQDRIEEIVAGTQAEVRVDASPNPLSGQVEHVGRQVEFTPRFLFSDRERPNLVIRVRVRVEDPRARLHAGVPAFVTFEGPTTGPSADHE